VAKQSRNFRLDQQTLESLQQLASKWNVSQAQVVELLVREADRGNKELRVTKAAK
jgi:hypothetical protein